MAAGFPGRQFCGVGSARAMLRYPEFKAFINPGTLNSHLVCASVSPLINQRLNPYS